MRLLGVLVIALLCAACGGSTSANADAGEPEDGAPPDAVAGDDAADDAAACDPDDWTLAAPNQAGDPALTQLGDATNGAVSVLLATSRHLYLGFDNATTGVQLYRAEIAPASIGDFRGRDGCLAGAAGCQGLGGNGLGTPGLSRFFDARAVTAAGATTVFLAAGDGSAPLRLFALPE